MNLYLPRLKNFIDNNKTYYDYFNSEDFPMDKLFKLGEVFKFTFEKNNVTVTYRIEHGKVHNIFQQGKSGSTLFDTGDELLTEIETDLMERLTSLYGKPTTAYISEARYAIFEANGKTVGTEEIIN